MYSNHRDSSSFREEQVRKQTRREHPVNANTSDSDLINVNELIGNIDKNAGNEF